MLVADPVMSAHLDSWTMEKKQTIGKAIGRIASGVFVVTTERMGELDGLLASWIAQAAFEPPMISVAVKKNRRLLELLGVGSRFTVNILSKKNADLFKTFAKPFKHGLDRFEAVALAPGGQAGPVIANSLAYLDCLTRTMVEAGDHVIVIGEIINGGMLNADDEPMVHMRGSGFQY